MNTKELNNWLCDEGVIGLAMDGHANACIGYLVNTGTCEQVMLVYDFEKVLEKLINEGMTREEAYEWYSFNMDTGQVLFIKTPGGQE